ncbi:MAG: hypothetical protein ABIB04_03440 [Patescibacteria group bacterium]
MKEPTSPKSFPTGSQEGVTERVAEREDVNRLLRSSAELLRSVCAVSSTKGAGEIANILESANVPWKDSKALNLLSLTFIKARELARAAASDDEDVPEEVRRQAGELSSVFNDLYSASIAADWLARPGEDHLGYVADELVLMLVPAEPYLDAARRKLQKCNVATISEASTKYLREQAVTRLAARVLHSRKAGTRADESEVQAIMQTARRAIEQDDAAKLARDTKELLDSLNGSWLELVAESKAKLGDIREYDLEMHGIAGLAKEARQALVGNDPWMASACAALFNVDFRDYKKQIKDRIRRFSVARKEYAEVIRRCESFSSDHKDDVYQGVARHLSDMIKAKQPETVEGSEEWTARLALILNEAEMKVAEQDALAKARESLNDVVRELRAQAEQLDFAVDRGEHVDFRLRQEVDDLLERCLRPCDTLTALKKLEADIAAVLKKFHSEPEAAPLSPEVATSLETKETVFERRGSKDFRCRECGRMDRIPKNSLEELKKGKSVIFACPQCKQNGRIAK